jgi:hypothetical protein
MLMLTLLCRFAAYVVHNYCSSGEEGGSYSYAGADRNHYGRLWQPRRTLSAMNEIVLSFGFLVI